MNRIRLQSWPLFASVFIFLLLVWLAVRISITQNQGHLIYALDDTYIEMAMAHNFSHFGVWGVTHYGFSGSASTILWVLLLSITESLLGPGQLAPFGWNLLFAILTLIAAHGILRWYKVPPVMNFLALLALVVLVPLPMLVLCGMEHTLQTFVSLVTLFLAARLLAQESPETEKRDSICLCVLAALVTATRFEGMALVAAISGISFLEKRWRPGLVFGVCGLVPVVIHGIISVHQGWFWLPASVLLKASVPASSSVPDFLLSIVNTAFVNFREGLHSLIMLLAVLLVYIVASGKNKATESRQIMGAIIAFLWLLDVEFVGAGTLYRYDAYLCALSFVFLAAQVPVIVPACTEPLSWSTWRAPRNIAYACLMMLFFLPLAEKGGRLLWDIPQCTTNIFDQQYQMGQFVQRYYQGSSVALNDIGAVNFIADIHCLDLKGLASRAIAVSRRKGTFGVQDMENAATQTGTRIAIVYDNWFPMGLPAGWIRVGRWTIPNDVIEGGDTVSFYATSSAEVPYLVQSLTDFAPRLPVEVLQRGH